MLEKYYKLLPLTSFLIVAVLFSAVSSIYMIREYKETNDESLANLLIENKEHVNNVLVRRVNSINDFLEASREKLRHSLKKNTDDTIDIIVKAHRNTDKPMIDVIRAHTRDRFFIAGSAYFYVLDSSGTLSLHQNKKLEGTTMAEMCLDKEGYACVAVKRFLDCIQTAENGCFYDYSWPKLGRTEPELKIGYVKKIPGTDYYLNLAEYEQAYEDLLEKDYADIYSPFYLTQNSNAFIYDIENDEMILSLNKDKKMLNSLLRDLELSNGMARIDNKDIYLITKRTHNKHWIIGSYFLKQDLINLNEEEMRSISEEMYERLGGNLFLVVIVTLFFSPILYKTGLKLEGHIEEIHRSAKARENLLCKIANYDYVTNQLSIGYFMTQSKGLAEMSLMKNKAMAILVIDLRDFKKINDIYGHMKGNEALKEIGSRIEMSVRGRGGSVARFGSDEFIVSIPLIRDIADASSCAAQVLQAINAPLVCVTETPQCSIGIAFFNKDDDSVEEVISRADLAMSRCQKTKEAFVFYSADMLEAKIRRDSIVDNIPNLIEKDEISLFYQPKYELDSNKIIGAEVLFRWFSPDIGFVRPDEVIPILEKTGEIVSVGEMILRKAIEDISGLRRRKQLGDEEFCVAINISMSQLERLDFPDLVLDIVEENQCSTKGIMFEITETQIAENLQVAILNIQKLMDYGFGISIDDFGTGYSSLSYLSQLPFTELKIDRAFVTDIEKGSYNADLINLIVKLAKQRDFSVICEGIETEEEQAVLYALGVEKGQGYLYSKPIPLEELRTFVRKNLGIEE